MGWQDAPEVSAAPAWASAPEVAAKPITKGERFAKGLRDPIDAGAQLLTNILPNSVVDAGNAANNWLADKTGMLPKLQERNVSSLVTGGPVGVDKMVRDQEAEYQRRRAASGSEGVDLMRIAGNVINPANLAIASRIPAAATLAGRVAAGAGAGVASSALNPVASGDFWEEKGKQALIGGVAGGAVPIVTNALARVISPAASVNPNVQALRAEGVRPTIGQTMGGMANRVEEKLTSVPVLGDAISHARRRAAEDVNRAAFNRALGPINQQLPRGMNGREAVQYADDAISAGYDRLLPRLTARADQAFQTELATLRQQVNTGALDPRSARAFNRILQNDVLSKFGGQQAMTGETLKRVESDLGQQIARMHQSTDADQRLVGDALQEVQYQLRQMLVRQNPNQAQQLGALNTAWANFKRVQRASSAIGAEDGIFSPAQLQNAVKALDRSKDKARFAEGNALMQNLSDPAKTVLGSKVPDSGTPGRLFAGLGAMLAGGLNPVTAPAAAAVAGGAGLYAARPVQNALAAALAVRPQAAQPIAQAFRQSSPMLVPLGAQVGLNAMDQ